MKGIREIKDLITLYSYILSCYTYSMRTLYPITVEKLKITYWNKEFNKEFHLNLIGTNMYYTSPYLKKNSIFKNLYKRTDFLKYNGRYSYV